MKVKDLKKILNQYPDDYPVILFDITTDDENYCSYSIEKEHVEELDLWNEERDETHKGVGVIFENKLNENPI